MVDELPQKNHQPDLDVNSHLLPSRPDPRTWTREDVVTFLRWCEREFDLPGFDLNQFQMNGKALCLLKNSNFVERAPGSGDILHGALQQFLTSGLAVAPQQQQNSSSSYLNSGDLDSLGGRSHLLPPPYPARWPTPPSAHPVLSGQNIEALVTKIVETLKKRLSPPPLIEIDVDIKKETNVESSKSGRECGERIALRCFKCNEEGHMSYNCTSADQNRGRRGGGGGRRGGGGGRRGGGGGRICYICNEEGHISYTCPRTTTRERRGRGNSRPYQGSASSSWATVENDAPRGTRNYSSTSNCNALADKNTPAADEDDDWILAADAWRSVNTTNSRSGNSCIEKTSIEDGRTVAYSWDEYPSSGSKGSVRTSPYPPQMDNCTALKEGNFLNDNQEFNPIAWQGTLNYSDRGIKTIMTFLDDCTWPLFTELVMPKSMKVVGTIHPEKVSTYLMEVKKTNSGRIAVFEFTPASKDEIEDYKFYFNELDGNNLFAVINNACDSNLPYIFKNFYLLSLSKDSCVPSELAQFVKNSFVQSRKSDLLLGVIVFRDQRSAEQSSLNLLPEKSNELEISSTNRPNQELNASGSSCLVTAESNQVLPVNVPSKRGKPPVKTIVTPASQFEGPQTRSRAKRNMLLVVEERVMEELVVAPKRPKKVVASKKISNSSPPGRKQCIMERCNRDAQMNKIYCSDECIEIHVRNSFDAMREHIKLSYLKKPQILINSLTPPSPNTSSDKTLRKDSVDTLLLSQPATPALTCELLATKSLLQGEAQLSSLPDDRPIPVIDTLTGTTLLGLKAPTVANVEQWIKQNATFRIIKPGIISEY